LSRRRFNIVPFLNRPAAPDHLLPDRLAAEWPSILRWMIDGCLDWQRKGLTRPACVLDATVEYFADQDLLGQWLAACCDLHPGNGRMRESSTDLHQSWVTFTKLAGEKAETQKAFVANLEKRVPDKYRSKASRGFEGIRLKSSG
jgi:putative DNA primase/helicase